MMVVQVTDRGPGSPRALFDASAYRPGHFDVAPNGQELLMIETDPAGAGRRLEVIFGWFGELERLAPREGAR